MKDLNNYRKSYEKSELLEVSISGNPVELFHTWLLEMDTSNNSLFSYDFL